MSNHGQHIDRDNPILAAYAQLEAALSAVEQAQAWSLNAAETRVALLADARVRSQLEGLDPLRAHHRTGFRIRDEGGDEVPWRRGGWW